MCLGVKTSNSIAVYKQKMKHIYSSPTFRATVKRQGSQITPDHYTIFSFDDHLHNSSHSMEINGNFVIDLLSFWKKHEALTRTKNLVVGITKYTHILHLAIKGQIENISETSLTEGHKQANLKELLWKTNEGQS